MRTERPRIGILFGDGAMGCWIRAHRISKRLGRWTDVHLRPYGGEYRDMRFRSWYEDITEWARRGALHMIIDDQALVGILVARALNIPVIAMIQHHPIWADSFGRAGDLLQFADQLVIPMWSWVGDEGLASLGALAERARWIGPIFDEGDQEALAEPSTLVVTAGSAKYDRTLLIIARQAAGHLADWAINLNDPAAGSEPLPRNCTRLPVTDQFTSVLARSQVVACAGGVTMLESIYYRKRPIVLPVPLQREQAWTAHRLASFGLVSVITPAIPARAFAEMVRANARDVDLAPFSLHNGLDRLEEMVRTTITCRP